MSCFDVLRGHRINGVFTGNSKESLVFRTISGKYFRFNTSGDCCNSVWFNHISGVTILGNGNSFDVLRGALVTGTQAKGWNDNRTSESDYDVVQEGFWTIQTDRGFIDIEVRNSHNGYYGGDVAYDEDPNLDRIEDLEELLDDF